MSWKIKEKLKATLEGESGWTTKEWGGKRSVALVYPREYGIGMANLAVHSIYDLLGSRDDIACERAFLPDANDMEEHLRTGTPVLSMETQRPLSDFDVIAFTVSFENDYLGIIPILEISKIDHRASERSDSTPLILAGGAAPTLAPLPLAGIADAIVLGEIEGYEDDLIPMLASMGSKGSTIAELSKLDGIVTGDKAEHARNERRRHAKDLDSFSTQTVIRYEKGQFHDMHLIEVERGCPRNCRFCATPAIYGETRMRGMDAIMAMAKDGISERKRMGLIGADLLSHPDFVKIAEEIHSLGATFSPSSVRADAIDDTNAKLLVQSGHRSIALGIEAANQKLRASLGKGISDERIMKSVATLARSGITRIKLYFMIGLPDETDDDIAAIPEFAKRAFEEIERSAEKKQRSIAVDITVTPFVPKPSTPFEGKPFAPENEIKGKLKELKRLIGKDRGISLGHDSWHEAACEHLLANGDESTVAFLEKAFELGNARKALRTYRERRSSS